MMHKPVKDSKVRKVLKEHVNMSYKMTKKVTIDPNIQYHKLRRHHFADGLLNLMQCKKLILNFDETSYDQESYTYKTWSIKS
jgi:hypothetical protein